MGDAFATEKTGGRTNTGMISSIRVGLAPLSDANDYVVMIRPMLSFSHRTSRLLHCEPHRARFDQKLGAHSPVSKIMMLLYDDLIFVMSMRLLSLLRWI